MWGGLSSHPDSPAATRAPGRRRSLAHDLVVVGGLVLSLVLLVPLIRSVLTLLLLLRRVFALLLLLRRRINGELVHLHLPPTTRGREDKACGASSSRPWTGHGQCTSQPGRCARQRAGPHASPAPRAVCSARWGVGGAGDTRRRRHAHVYCGSGAVSPREVRELGPSRHALRARSMALRFACPDVVGEGGGVRRRVAAEKLN